MLAALAPKVPEMFGGSADLTGSNLTDFPGCGERHVSYGVREFGMAAIMNGVALHGGYIPYGGTFLTFSDYSRNAVRMAALMKLRVIHVFTHDSIGLGEDGPTHQAVEHVPSLRLIPQLDVWRPADTIETAVAWAQRAAAARRPGRAGAVAPGAAGGGHAGAVRRHRPRRLCAVRCTRRPGTACGAHRHRLGAAVRLAGAKAAGRRRPAGARGVDALHQRLRPAAASYRDQVLPPQLPAVAVEAAQPDFWRKYVGRDGGVVGIASFGESAPAADLYKHFGITAEHVAAEVRRCLGL